MHAKRPPAAWRRNVLSRALRTTLNLILTFAVVGALVACARELPDVMKRDQQMRFDQALNRCEQGFTAYCQQVANGGNYAH